MQCSRRQFIAIAAAFASTSALVNEARADAQAVTPSDPTAQALGYQPSAAKVDRAKFAKYQPGQMCSNCQFFQGKPGALNGPCPMFGGKLVDAGGWCSAYTKKA